MRHREMTIQRGHKYSISFTAYSTQPTTIRPKVGMQGPPFAEPSTLAPRWLTSTTDA